MMKKRHKLLPWPGTAIALVLAAGVAAGVTASRAQQQKGNPGLQNVAAQLQQQQMAMEQAKVFASGQVSGTTANPRQVGSSSSFPAVPGDDPTSFIQESVRTKRNDERQKRLESDTRRLLNLASQLKSEVEASGAESMTPEMLRQMDEIEKLAKSVKERMRN